MPTPPEPVEDALYYPIAMTRAGVVPQSPADLRAQLINLVTYGTDKNGNQVMQPLPGYTAALPGSLIEDISSTDVGALIMCDQARVELINSLTPYAANAFIMAQLGQLFGIPFGTTTNISVGVVFVGTIGFMIQAGFQVSDGSHTYVVQDGGIIEASGQSAILNAVALTAGSWAVPAGAVTTMVTSVPSSITLSVTNPYEGSGGASVETEQEYRLRMLQACVVACQGTPDMLKTLVGKVPGVLQRLIGVQAVAPNYWKIIVGGSNPDPYAIANAIYRSVPIVCSLIGSVITVDAVTNANPGKVTTDLNHGYASGQVVTFVGCQGMMQLNTGSYTITVVNEKEFTIGVNTSAYPAYTGGGHVLPNLRNNSVTIYDYPDLYTIPFVTPPAQQVTVQLTWYARGNIASASVISQVAQGAIVNYVNGIPVGVPLNLLAMQEQVQDTIEPYVSLDQVSGMDWIIAINGVAAPPVPNLMICEGDPESYFVTTPGQVTVVLG